MKKICSLNQKRPLGPSHAHIAMFCEPCARVHDIPPTNAHTNTHTRARRLVWGFAERWDISWCTSKMVWGGGKGWGWFLITDPVQFNAVRNIFCKSANFSGKKPRGFCSGGGGGYWGSKGVNAGKKANSSLNDGKKGGDKDRCGRGGKGGGGGNDGNNTEARHDREG